MSDLSYEALLKSQEESRHGWAFFITAVLALSLAVAGWGKLRFGLSFIDEGMYLTDGWRLAHGDRLFPDANRFAASFYHLFSSWVFHLIPDAGVLTIRRVQYFLNLFAIATLLCVFLKGQKPAQMYGPLLASTPFLYLGLDPTGMGTSLNYYTITSFFFLLHLAAVVAYGKEMEHRKRTLLAFLAGVLIAAAGISYLAAGAAGILFLLLPILRRARVPKRDLAAYLLPALLYPLTIYPNFEMHWQALSALFSVRSETELFFPYTIPHLIHGAIFVGAGLLLTRIKSQRAFFVGAVGLGALLSASLYTRGFSLLPLFWNGWFKIPGMVATLNAVAAIVALLLITKNAVKEPLERTLPATVLILGFLLYASFFALTSSLGVLLMLSSSVALWIGVSWLLCYHLGPAKGMALAIAFMLPSSAFLLRADYQFTYFDKAPSQLDTVIQDGPAAGIQTNSVNAFIEGTIRKAVATNTDEGDLILSFDQTPMVYFLGRRRPAVDHSWIGITGGNEENAKNAIQKMIVANRIPKLALHWQNKFLWIPLDEQFKNFTLSGFSASTERPILAYVRSNMTRVATINIGELPMVEIYKENLADDGAALNNER